MESERELKDAILEAQVEASFQCHDLGPFEPVEVLTGGYEARCRKCNQTAWVGESGLMYSLLGSIVNGIRHPGERRLFRLFF
jgi:hypothetical protein